jgi:hypothetical protein
MSSRKDIDAQERSFLLDGTDSDVIAREEFDRLEAEQSEADIRAALEIPAVRRMLWRSFERAGILETSFDNSGWTNFFEGRREQALWMLKQLKSVKPGITPIMMSETEALRASRLKPSKQ